MTDEQLPDPLPLDVVAAIQQGDKVEAIKRLRLARNVDLKGAKAAVDGYIRSDPVLARKYRRQATGTLRVLWLLIAGMIAVALLYLAI